MEKHNHKWKTSDKSNMLICAKEKCDTMTDLHTALENARIDSAHETKVSILVTQLRNGDLKKAAHDQAYQFVRREGQNVEVPQQESFI